MRDFFGSSNQSNEISDDENTNYNKKKNKKVEKHIYIVEEITSELIDKFFTYLSLECNLKNTSIKHYRNQISVAFELLDKKNIMPKPTKGIEELKEIRFHDIKTYNSNRIKC